MLDRQNYSFIVIIITINPESRREEKQLNLCCASSSLSLFLWLHWQVGEQKFSLAGESCGLSQWAGSGTGFHVNTEAEPPMGRESLFMGRGKLIARVWQATERRGRR